jgi:hypothetical protein
MRKGNDTDGARLATAWYKLPCPHQHRMKEQSDPWDS